MHFHGILYSLKKDIYHAILFQCTYVNALLDYYMLHEGRGYIHLLCTSCIFHA